MEFQVLASGSSGNAAFVRCEGFGLLIDVGIGPRALQRRLETVGASWDDVHAVLLTHTHGDHWTEEALAEIHRRAVPLFCHPDHVRELWPTSLALAALETAGLVRCYDVQEPWHLAEGLSCRAFHLAHDGGTTCGFRIRSADFALAYAADLGCWRSDTVDHLADVDLLALEFNYDEEMLRRSGRPSFLVERVRSDRGHLSNEQAASLLSQVLARSSRNLQVLVQIHLSRQCNRAELAQAAAAPILRRAAPAARLVTAGQARPTSTLRLEPSGEAGSAVAAGFRQSFLPGWE